MEERFTIDYKIKLAKYDDKMYKLTRIIHGTVSELITVL